MLAKVLVGIVLVNGNVTNDNGDNWGLFCGGLWCSLYYRWCNDW